MPSYYDAVRDLPDEERLLIYDAIMDFGFGNDVGPLPPLLAGYFKLMIPSIERSIRFEEKQRANGCKGGRPANPKDNPAITQLEPRENLAIAVAVEGDVAVEDDVRGADKPPARPRFSPPSLDEVRSYCTERGGVVDPERFVDFYQANGWVQGKGKPIRDWKAAVRLWERRNNGHKRDSSIAANSAGKQFDIHYDVC